MKSYSHKMIKQTVHCIALVETEKKSFKIRVNLKALDENQKEVIV